MQSLKMEFYRSQERIGIAFPVYAEYISAPSGCVITSYSIHYTKLYETTPLQKTANIIRMMKRKVDGVLLLDKPAGLTSNTALQKAKRLFNAAKAGHTGTLDSYNFV